MPTRRLFFALWLDELAARAAHLAAQQLAEDNGGRVMRQESLHLTLAFLGNIDEALLPELMAIAAQCAASTRRFGLCLNQTGYWQHKRIAWASCQLVPPELNQLANALLSGRGVPPRQQPYFPHVTLLRSCRTDSFRAVPIDIPIPVKAFCLIESLRLENGNGSHYKTMATYPLRSPQVV